MREQARCFTQNDDLIDIYVRAKKAVDDWWGWWGGNPKYDTRTKLDVLAPFVQEYEQINPASHHRF